MIHFDKFTLENGLRVLVHQDQSTPLAVVNLLYDVGARDEQPDKTGFAHLFEHLMFGGSANIPAFDTPLQEVGGDNNAFTNNDFTNYYISLPKQNLETAFWLESDRMLSLAFSEASLEVQRNVVIEEFRQNYLNQPYGDVWLHLLPLAYKKHPYRWATIGKDIRHIEQASLADVKEFFYKFYAPNNAILVVAGDVQTAQVKELCQKWFAPIPAREVPRRNLPAEPRQNKPRSLSLRRDVPLNAIYKTYQSAPRLHHHYYVSDLLSDLLANGKSARLYQNLVKTQRLFSHIDAYITGGIDLGLFTISGHLMQGVSFEQAEEAIEQEIAALQNSVVPEKELKKVKNKLEANWVYAQSNVLNKAINLAVFELISHAGDVNSEIGKYLRVSAEDVRQLAKTMLRPENCSTLYYKSNQIAFNGKK